MSVGYENSKDVTIIEILSPKPENCHQEIVIKIHLSPIDVAQDVTSGFGDRNDVTRAVGTLPVPRNVDLVFPMYISSAYDLRRASKDFCPSSKLSNIPIFKSGHVSGSLDKISFYLKFLKIVSKLFSRILIILKKIFEIFGENLEQINFGEKCYKNSVT